MAAITRQWWRRLVNTYEVEADMVCLVCNNCVIYTWVLQRRASHNGALYKSIFLFRSFTVSATGSRPSQPVLQVMMRLINYQPAVTSVPCVCKVFSVYTITQKSWSDQLQFFCGHSRDSWPAWVCTWVLWLYQKSCSRGSVLACVLHIYCFILDQLSAMVVCCANTWIIHYIAWCFCILFYTYVISYIL